jgi:hypothetical protein
MARRALVLLLLAGCGAATPSAPPREERPAEPRPSVEAPSDEPVAEIAAPGDPPSSSAAIETAPACLP